MARCDWKKLSARGYSCSGWMTLASGSAITRCLAAFYASAANGSWRTNCPKYTAPPPKAGWRKASSEAIHHALAAGDAHMLRDILLNHAWGLFNHSELTLLEESLKALLKACWKIRVWFCYRPG